MCVTGVSLYYWIGDRSNALQMLGVGDLPSAGLWFSRRLVDRPSCVGHGRVLAFDHFYCVMGDSWEHRRFSGRYCMFMGF